MNAPTLAYQIESIASLLPLFPANPYLALCRKRIEEARRSIASDARRAEFFLNEAKSLLRYADEFDAIQKLRHESV